MKRSYVLTGLGLIAAVGLISTAVAGPGGGSSRDGAAQAAAKKGRRGPPGPQGAAGPQGPQGIQGIQGNPGTPATRLQACVALNATLCTATEGANVGLNGAVTHTGGSNTYVVHFNQSVAGCNGFAQESLAGMVATGTASPTNNDITVTTFDATGAAAERGFRLAVFC